MTELIVVRPYNVLDRMRRIKKNKFELTDHDLYAGI